MSAIDASSSSAKIQQANIDFFAAGLCVPGADESVYNTGEAGDTAQTSFNQDEFVLGANGEASNSQVANPLDGEEDDFSSVDLQQLLTQEQEYDTRLRA